MKKLLTMLLSLLIVLFFFSALAESQPPTIYTYGCYEYRILSDNTIEITRYIPSDYPDGSIAVPIPEEIEGRVVTSIGDYAFSGAWEPFSITIPNTVTKIGNYAFSECSYLSAIYMSGSVKSIGANAFDQCERLYQCNEPYSFILPEGVISIGDMAFSGCRMVDATIPNSVTILEGNPFANCEYLEDITVSIDHPQLEVRDGVLIDKVDQKIISYPQTLKAKCYTIPQGIRSIGVSAFYDCRSLESIIYPDSLSIINDNAFYGCDGIRNVELPSSLSHIGNYAFYACWDLNSITLPDNLVSIGDYAFSSCDSLASIIIPNSVKTIGSGAFELCSSLTSITVTPNSYAHQYCIDNDLPFVLAN